MRVWNFSRSGGVVSAPINWIFVRSFCSFSGIILIYCIKSIKTIIEIVIRLCFTTEASLGVDRLSIQRYKLLSNSDFNLQYRFKVNKNYYRSVGKVLADKRANLFFGRGTRVFGVVPSNSTDAHGAVATHALKVYWPKADAEQSEGELLRMVRNLLKGRDELKYFLDFVEDEFCTIVMPDGKIVPDATKSIIRKPLISESFYPDRMDVDPSRDGIPAVEGSALDAPLDATDPLFHNNSATGISNDFDMDVEKFLTLRWVDRNQYRIVFDWIGRSIGQVQTLYQFFVALCGAFRGK